MGNRLNACHIYLFVILLCGLNGSLYPSGGFIAQGLQYVLILMSLYYALYANQHYSLPSYFIGLDVLLLMFTFYGMVLLMKGERLVIQEFCLEIPNTAYLKSIYKSLLPVYPFYVFTRQGLLKEKTVKVWFFIFLVLAINSYYKTEARLLRAALENEHSSKEEFTNNTGYTFVALLPALILFHKKPILQYLGIILCTFFIVSAMKRGAIVCWAVCVCWFMIINYKKAETKRKRWIVAFVSLGVILFAVYLFVDMMQHSYYFQLRLAQTEEGNSTGRDQLFSVFFHHFINENSPWRFLFGNGASATLKIGPNFAHNDWLEIAINQGILGLIVFLSYWVCFYHSWQKTSRNPQAFMAIGMIFIIYLLSTMFSMSYTSVTRCAAMLLGYYLAGMNYTRKV